MTWKTTDDRVQALVDLVIAGNLTAALPVAENVRARLDDLTAATIEGARVSHIQWVAEKVRTIATDLLTEAQLREEEAIENLVRAKNACDETVAPAEAVLAAAVAVEEIERNIDWLTQLIDDPNDTTGEEPADDEDDTAPAGDCDA